jgi:hypothetical protein
MSSTSLWGDALKNATPQQVLGFAVEAPKLLTGVSASNADVGVRDTGLLLTKKQIIDLRKYEAAGLALPYTLKDVEDYLRFGAGQDGGAGLKPADFLTTFQNTRNHARRWSPLRERIMMTGQGLQDFAKSMQTYGASMKEVYSEVKASGLLQERNIKTLAQLKELELELGDKFPGIELEPDTVETLDYFLTRIFEKIDNNLNIVEGIKNDLDLFGYDLREHILPGIKLRVGLIDSSSMAADIKRLKAVIEDRSKEIDIKNTEYKAAVQEALKAAAGMNIVGLAMAIYMGVEAENIRSARNTLYADQERDIQVLASKNQTLGALARVKHDLQSLMIVAIDADVATQNLMHVWSVLHLCVKNSVGAVNRINDALSLRIFMTEFEEVVNPWKQIETDSNRLIKVFGEADDEYDRNYSLAPRTMNVGSLFSLAYPPLNLTALTSSHEQMRDDRTQANVWLLKLGYLPDLFDRFNRLVTNVGQGASQLQSSALESHQELENTLRRLARNENDRNAETDPEVIEEIEDERKHLLASATRAIADKAGQVRCCLGNIQDRFDRRLTEAYILDFKRDEQLANAEIVDLQSKLVALKEERQVIVDAVSTLEKSGIEEIGKDIELTIGKITELGLTPPEIKLVMMAIDQLKKTIIDAGKAVRFLDMLRESDKLQQKVEDLINEIDRETSIVHASTGKVIYLQAIHSIEGAREKYIGEYSVAVATFDKFLTAIEAKQFVDDDAFSAAFKEQASLFINFLVPVSLPQR